MKVRPMGISILASAFIILGVYSFTMSLLVFGFSGLTALFGDNFILNSQLSQNLWAGLLGMITAAVQLVVGIGLLGMKTWAWYLAFIGAALGVVQALFGFSSAGSFSFICAAIGLLIPIGVVIYLLSSEVRQTFDIGSSPS